MLTIYGATGYTGRLCAAEAVRQGLPVRLAGRRGDALEQLGAELGVDEIEVADAADPDGLRGLAERSSVLLTTVGPYLKLGRPVVEAAIEGGAHYLDVTGELAFVEWVHGRDADARRGQVAVVSGVGFDGVPGDLLAGLCAQRLDGPVDEVAVAYLVRHGRASRGTAKSALGMVRSGSAAHDEGRLVDEPPFARRWQVPFPEPLGERAAASVPLPELITVPRSVGATRVSTYFVTPVASVLNVASGPLSATAGLLASSPLWDVLERAADKLPEGPGRQQRREAKAAVLVEVRGPSGTVRAWLRLGDIYGSTAKIAVGYARRLLDPGPPAHGALTPWQAAGSDAEGLLDEIGAVWEWC